MKTEELKSDLKLILENFLWRNDWKPKNKCLLSDTMDSCAAAVPKKLVWHFAFYDIPVRRDWVFSYVQNDIELKRSYISEFSDLKVKTALEQKRTCNTLDEFEIQWFCTP